MVNKRRYQNDIGRADGLSYRQYRREDVPRSTGAGRVGVEEEAQPATGEAISPSVTPAVKAAHSSSS